MFSNLKNNVVNASREEALILLEKRRKFGDYLVEKWSRSEPGKKLDLLYSKNPDKARTAAMLLENQAKHLKYLVENGVNVSQYFQTTPQNVLKIVRIGVANSNRANIFTEYPLLTMHDALYFIYKQHGSTKRGATEGDLIVESDANEWMYPTEIYQDPTTNTIDLTAGSSHTLAATSYSPITTGSVRVVAVSTSGVRTYIGYDDGEGRISDIFGGTLINSASSSINYNNGNTIITIPLNATTGNLALDSKIAGSTIFIEYHFDTERPTLYPEIGTVKIEVKSLRFRPRPYPISYQYTHLARLQLETTKLGDLEDSLLRAVGEEHAIRRDYQAFSYARQIAETNPTYQFETDFTVAGEDNDFNHAQRLVTAIQAVSSDIYRELKRGEVNKIITTRIGAAYLAKLIRFVPDHSQPRVAASYLAGTLDGIEVYVTPPSPQTVDEVPVSGNKYDVDMLLVYKNPQNDGEPSIAFGVLTELAAALDYPELYRKGVVASIEDQVVVQRKFIRLLKLKNVQAFGA